MRGLKSMMVAAPKAFGVGKDARASERDVQLTLFDGTRSLGATVAAGKFLHPAGRIYKLLLTREKRMASGTDADSNVSFGRASVINRAARANEVGLLIIGMNVRLHIQKRAENLAAEGQIRK